MNSLYRYSKNLGPFGAIFIRDRYKVPFHIALMLNWTDIFPHVYTSMSWKYFFVVSNIPIFPEKLI